MWTEALHTVGSERGLTWAHALANEWLIWFTVLYVALVGAQAALARIAGREGDS